MSLIDDKNALAFEFGRLCSEAGLAIMEIYNSDFAARDKDDASPVTDADEVAEKIILAGLEKLLPGIPVLAEESFSAGFRPDVGSTFVLVDPVDGTKEFINKNGEFTVNIALIENRVPTAGCVYAPARERIYIGGTKAWAGPLKAGDAIVADTLAPISTRTQPAGGLTGVMSRRAQCSGRRCASARRRALPLRQDRNRIPQWRLRRLGRAALRAQQTDRQTDREKAGRNARPFFMR